MLLREELTGGIASYELFAESDSSGRQVYGIGIASSLPYDTGCIQLSDITESLPLANELFGRVIAYMVTPCELMYVAEDFIFEKYGR